MDLIKELESQQMKAEKPVANVGDTVRVHVKILSKIWDYNYSGETRTVDVHIRTLRQKLGAYGEKIETVRTGFVRRAKLYYLRDRVGKAAKIREKL